MRGRTFLLWALGLVAVDLFLPYFVLADSARFGASFLFWCVFTLAVIVWAARHTRSWSDK